MFLRLLVLKTFLYYEMEGVLSRVHNEAIIYEPLQDMEETPTTNPTYSTSTLSKLMCTPLNVMLIIEMCLHLDLNFVESTESKQSQPPNTTKMKHTEFPDIYE